MLNKFFEKKKTREKLGHARKKKRTVVWINNQVNSKIDKLKDPSRMLKAKLINQSDQNKSISKSIDQARLIEE